MPLSAGLDAIATPEGLRNGSMCSEARSMERNGGINLNGFSGPPRYRSRGRSSPGTHRMFFEYEWEGGSVAEMPLGQNAIFVTKLTPQGKLAY